MNRFDVVLPERAVEFLYTLDQKAREKIIYNLDKSRQVNNPKLFKKLTGEIWEFRTLYSGQQYRLLAFWDKRDKQNVLVVATHGIVKKTRKVPKGKLVVAEDLRQKYFEE